jgi:chloramphenicol O-acetyltransferase type B
MPAAQIGHLIIGKFCSVTTGVKFMISGNHGHNHRQITTFPLDFLDNDFDRYRTVVSPRFAASR